MVLLSARKMNKSLKNLQSLSIKLFIKLSVELEVSTWAKDSHALYDYEGVDNKFQVDKYDLKDSVNIFRHVTSNY